MGFKYGVVDPKDMKSYRLIEPGEGKFKIVEAVEDAVSSKGNPMMTITFKIVNFKGEDTLFTMYLIKNDDPVQIKTTATKIYNLLGAIGKLDLYGKELRAVDILGCSGKCTIKTQKSTDDKFPDDKSVIGKFLPLEKAVEQIEDSLDDLPF